MMMLLLLMMIQSYDRHDLFTKKKSHQINVNILLSAGNFTFEIGRLGLDFPR
jgi:hypothetical protein